MIPVFIINLPRDVRERETMRAQFLALPEFDARFVDGVDGGTLPASVRVALGGTAKGTLGCFLSHVRVWEMVAELQDAAFAVVLEDDTDVAQLRMIFLVEIPADAEIVFINNRMSPNLALERPGVVDMATALRHLDVRIGSGGDGYLLSPSGARKLAAAMRTDLFSGHVDNRLLRYAAAPADVDALAADSFTATVIREHHDLRRAPEMGLLKGYVSSLPIVRHAGWPSRRDALDRSEAIVPAAPRLPPQAWPGGFGDCFPAMAPHWRDFARGRPAVQSSHSEWSRGADREADAAGALQGLAVYPYAFHTAEEDAPWWQVDLGETRRFRHVVVTNRSEPAFHERAVPLRGSVSEDGLGWRDIFLTPPGLIFGFDGHSLVWRGEQDVAARFLRLTVGRRSWLHLAQVQVFGEA